MRSSLIKKVDLILGMEGLFEYFKCSKIKVGVHIKMKI